MAYNRSIDAEATHMILWDKSDKNYKIIENWINSADYGPGIPVGNFGSKPNSIYLSYDEKYLFVGNLGTQDISIIDLKKNC